MPARSHASTAGAEEVLPTGPGVPAEDGEAADRPHKSRRRDKGDKAARKDGETPRKEKKERDGEKEHTKKRVELKERKDRKEPG